MTDSGADAAGGVTAEGSDDAARRTAASRVLARSVIGHRLLSGYYAAAAVALITISVTARGVAWWAIAAAMGTGFLLLAGVRFANAAARRPLRQGWPMLAAVTGTGRPGRSGGWRPLDGGAGFTYVLALLALAALAGIIYAVSGAAAASATTSVSVGTCQSTIRGPDVCSARWQAGGRTYAGRITWASTSDQGTVIGGRYNPADPGTIYAASLSFIDATSVYCIAFFIALAPLSSLLYVKAVRPQRATYLEALAGAGATGLRRSRTPFGHESGAQ